MRLYLINFLLLLLPFTASLAQTTPDLETDRPDQTETPFSVGRRMFQAENGFSVTKVNQSEYVQQGVSLLRYGLSEKFEFRAELVGENVRINKKYYSNGIAPVELGFKANIFEEKGWIPKTSLIAHLAFPGFASNSYQGNYFAPNFRFTMQHMLGKKQSFSYNLGGEWSTDKGQFMPLYTLATGYDISSKWYGYIEFFGFFPQKNTAEHSFDGGLAYLVRPNLQLDISAGIGLTSTAPKAYAAIGLSFRLPK